MRRTAQVFGAAAAAAALVITSSGIAFADTLTNSVSVTPKVVSANQNTAATVSFTLTETDGTTAVRDANGCNATTQAPVTLRAGATNVTVDHNPDVAGDQAERVVTQCGTYAFTFRSSTVGDHLITATATGGKNNSSYDTSGAGFTLRVTAPTSLTTGSASAAYDAESVTLSARLKSGTTDVAGKSVAFTVGGVSAGSATTNTNGIASLTYTLNKTKNVGDYTVAVAFAGDTHYGASSASSTLSVTKASQAIDFGALSNRTFGTAGFTVAASASSGLAVSFASTTSDHCSVSGTTVTLGNAGTCTIRASQSGGSNYNAAPHVDRSFSVTKADQNITLSLSRETASFGDGQTTNVQAGASSGLAVALETDGPCSLGTAGEAGVPVTVSGAGDCVVTATQGGNGNYNAAPSQDRTLVIGKGTQNITFGVLSGKTYGDQPFPVSATSSSGLDVMFASDTPSVCSVSGAQVTLLTAGDCTVVASQTGNTDWNAATDVPRTFTVAKRAQTITFDQALPQVAFGSGSVQLAATSDAPGATIAYTSSDTAVCTVSGSNVSLTGVGTCRLTANSAGDGNHEDAAAVERSFEIVKGTQSIDFAALSNKTYGAADFDLSAVATSALTVAFTAGPASVCTVTGVTLDIHNVGTCTVTASQAGDPRWNAATSVERPFEVEKATQGITWSQTLADRTYGATAQSLSASSDKGLIVAFTSLTESVCTIADGSVSVVGVGQCQIEASQAGDDNHEAADPVTRSFTVNQATQAITFAQPADRQLSSAAFELTGSADSHLAVSYTSNSTSVCTVDGATVTLVAVGTCSITASQAGNANWASATDVNRSFEVTRGSQTITFNTLADRAYGTASFTLSATASSGLPVTFSGTTDSICTVAGSTVTLVGVGLCSITASQGGTAGFHPAEDVARSFTVSKGIQPITFGTLADRVFGDTIPALSATAGDLTVDFSSTTPAVCTVSGTTITAVKQGTCTVRAAHAGGELWDAATAERSFAISYRYSTVLQPINTDRSSAFKAGSTIPVKFQVINSLNAVQTASDVVASIKVTKTGSATASTVNETVLTSSGDSGTAFRWDATGKQYIYNLSTKNWSMGEGTYQVDVLVGSTPVATSHFSVKK